MGYTTAPYSVFASDTKQSPKTVEMVLDFAGWTAEEAAEAIDVAASNIESAVTGEFPLLDGEWQKLLDVAGRRAFDFDGESV